MHVASIFKLINLLQDEEAAIEKDTENEKTDDNSKVKENRFQFLQKFTKFLQHPDNENGGELLIYFCVTIQNDWA